VRRRWLFLRMRLPWWLFALTRPSEPLVMDWRQIHGWGRSIGRVWHEVPFRPRWDRYPSLPEHLCYPEWACVCFQEVVSDGLIAARSMAR
jgi:hypothetical protein